MKIKVIKYKTIRIIERILFFTSFGMLFFMALIYYNHILMIILALIAILYLILYYLPKYTIIGYLTIEDNFFSFEDKEEEIKDIYMFYGGYDGEIVESFEMIFTGKWWRTGDQNYIVINNKVFPFYLGSNSQAKKLKDTIFDLEDKGVKVEWNNTIFGKRLSKKYML
ncbi:MAG: hypothetical protein H6Q16_2106 [Bacteroidetes bacterium]|nr:hypothetical protein [Bacteroidota bacterium]